MSLSQPTMPNIIPMHELGVAEGGRLYFTMKRVKGQDLKHILAHSDYSLVQLLADRDATSSDPVRDARWADEMVAVFRDLGRNERRTAQDELARRHLAIGMGHLGHPTVVAALEEGTEAVSVEALSADVAPGIKLYHFTESGLALQATVQGAKFWRDNELMSLQAAVGL